MNDLIDQATKRRIAAEIVKNIDVAAIAKRITPQAVKRIEIDFLACVSDWDWSDEISAMMDNKEVRKALAAMMVEAFAARRRRA